MRCWLGRHPEFAVIEDGVGKKYCALCGAANFSARKGMPIQIKLLLAFYAIVLSLLIATMDGMVIGVIWASGLLAGIAVAAILLPSRSRPTA